MVIEHKQKLWCLNLQHSSLFSPMRHHFQTQPDLQITPIEKIRLPLKSRDELPPILAGLQWIWLPPTLKAEIFALLEAKILAGKQATGRTGMNLWQILVLGGVRLGLDADWGLHARGGPGVVEPVCANGGEAQTRKAKRGGNGTRERPEICGAAKTTPRGGKRKQQSGASRPEPLPGRGDQRLPKVCGRRRDELQPAHHRTGTARAPTRARRHARAGGLTPPHLKTPAKSDRGGVFVAGEF